MELLQLKYFQTVARLQHISRAADELNITQPSLSVTISRLEDELGTKLFDRKGRNIKLNEAGRVFLTKVDTIFCELENAKYAVQEISGILSKHIAIATTNPRLLSGILQNFLSNYNEVVIHQSCEISDTIEKLLRAGDIDFCLAAPPLEGKGIESIVLKEDEIALIVPKNHRFANRTSIRLIEAANDSFITLVQNYNYRKFTDLLCRSAGFVPNIVFEVDDVLMSEMMSLGRGIALLPMYIILQYQNIKQDLVMVRIDEPKCSLEIGLSWIENKYLTTTGKKFKNYMIDNYHKFFEIPTNED